MILIPALVTLIEHRCDAPFVFRLIIGLVGKSKVAKMRSIGSYRNSGLQPVVYASVMKSELSVHCI